MTRPQTRQTISLWGTLSCHILLLVTLLSSFAVATTAAGNELRNASFEAPHPTKSGMPADWGCARIYGTGPTHFEWSADARTGAHSLRMTAMHVTQLVCQDVKLPIGSPYTFRFYAKGSGKFHVFVHARAAHKIIDHHTRADWTVTDRWLPYEISGSVPEGTDVMRFHVGTPMVGCDVLIDDAEVVLDAPAPQAGSEPELTDSDLVNATPMARLDCVPYAGLSTAELHDGHVGWGGLRPEHRPGRGARFAFRWERPVTVCAVEFVQDERRTALSYLIDVDTDGDRQFDTTLARATGTGHGGTWQRHVLRPTRVHAIRFCGLQGLDRYGMCYPVLREFSILVRPEGWLRAPPAEPAPRNGPPDLSPVGVPRPLPEVSRDVAVPMTERTARGAFVESWMFGFNKTSRPPFSELPSVNHFLDQLEHIGADHVMLFPQVPGTLCPVWPSKVVKGHDWDVLTPLVDTLEARHIRTLVIFGKLSEQLKPDRPWPQWFGQLLAEVASRGAHGASICADEFPQCGGGPDPAFYQQELQRALGLEQKPAVREDTEAYRRWKLFNFRQYAAAHQQAAAPALALRPDFVYFSNVRVDPIRLNQTVGCLAYDILATGMPITYFGTDPYYNDHRDRVYMERTVKILSAAARPRKALPVLKGGSWDFAHLERYQGILLNGSAIASVMHGAGGVSFYRLNYLFLNNKAHLVREAFRLIEWLDLQGLPNTQTPPVVAVLHSRASEDFWQLRQELTTGPDQRVAAIRGYIVQMLIEEFLLRESIPFDIHYIEREDDLSDLARYGLIILPFPYCLSEAAARRVEQAWEAGSRVMLCERLGDADQLGTPRPTPLLADWKARERIAFVENVLDNITRAEFRADLSRKLDELLGAALPVAVARYGRNVEVILREGAAGRRLLAVLNWEPADSVCDIRLRLPEGRYRVQQCDGFGTRPAAIAGEQLVTEASLRQFRVRLNRDQVRVYDIRPVR